MFFKAAILLTEAIREDGNVYQPKKVGATRMSNFYNLDVGFWKSQPLRYLSQ